MIYHTTCISLARRADRRAAIETYLRPYVSNLTVLDAIDAQRPEAIPDDVLRRMKVMPKAKEGAREKKAACWTSHVLALTRAIEHDAFPQLIVEDDVVPSSDEALASVPWDTMPTDSVSFLAGCFQAAKVKNMKEFEKDGRAQTIAGTLNPGWVRDWDKSEFRISSSSAYVVPTASVARDLVRTLTTKSRLTHYDIDLYEAPEVKSFYFPSPLVSGETARVSDIMTSQSIVFDKHYSPVKASRKRARA